jgi:hypothetical protein
MTPVKHSTVTRPSAVNPHPRQTDGTDTDGRGVLHFESLRVPDLMSVPLFVAWLRKPFRRKDTSTIR